MATRLEHEGIKLFDSRRDICFTTSSKSKQAAKLLEEVGEFIEAVMDGDCDNALMEAGDVAWLLVDMLHVMGSDYLLAVGMHSALDKLKLRVSESLEKEALGAD